MLQRVWSYDQYGAVHKICLLLLFLLLFYVRCADDISIESVDSRQWRNHDL